jgi:Tfp pilus assembly protein PilV
MKRMLFSVAVLAAATLAQAQVGTTLKEGAAATSEKAQQLGDQTKAAVSSQPNKAIDKAKAQTHKAKAHAHAKAAKDAAKDVPK